MPYLISQLSISELCSISVFSLVNLWLTLSYMAPRVMTEDRSVSLARENINIWNSECSFYQEPIIFHSIIYLRSLYHRKWRLHVRVTSTYRRRKTRLLASLLRLI